MSTSIRFRLSVKKGVVTVSTGIECEIRGSFNKGIKAEADSDCVQSQTARDLRTAATAATQHRLQGIRSFLRCLKEKRFDRNVVSQNVVCEKFLLNLTWFVLINLIRVTVCFF